MAEMLPVEFTEMQPTQPIFSEVNDKEVKKTTGGRRKIPIEFIEDKSRRTITFSKRKHGIMKKAFELSTLTGTQILLLVASETGHVYTFATPKLQPLITKPDGKNLIQACLNAPDNVPMGQSQCSSQSPMIHHQQTPMMQQSHPHQVYHGGYNDVGLNYPSDMQQENMAYGFPNYPTMYP